MENFTQWDDIFLLLLLLLLLLLPFFYPASYSPLFLYENIIIVENVSIISKCCIFHYRQYKQTIIAGSRLEQFKIVHVTLDVPIYPY